MSRVSQCNSRTAIFNMVIGGIVVSLLFITVSSEDICSKYESCVALHECPHKFSNIKEMFAKNCDIGKVCCHMKENPCSLLPEEGLLLYPPDKTCHQPLSTGPCPTGQWLVQSAEDFTLSCQPRPCPEEKRQVLYQGHCVDGTDQSHICNNTGQIWVHNPRGEAVCVCDEDFVEAADGNCYVEFNHGFCNSTFIVRNFNGIVTCVANPCEDPTRRLPYLHSSGNTTRRLEDNCYNASKVDENNCLTEIEPADDNEDYYGSSEDSHDEDSEYLRCKKDSNDDDITSAGPSGCKRRRVWCDY